MLELDLQLLPFVEQQFSVLTDDEKEAYENLLEKEDWEIYDWLRGVCSPKDPELKSIIDRIVDYNLVIRR